jgi:hypothetical protein
MFYIDAWLQTVLITAIFSLSMFLALYVIGKISDIEKL